MKIQHRNKQSYFPEGGYQARVVSAGAYKTIDYGMKLLVVFEIQNEHGRTMQLNDYFDPWSTKGNRAGKFFEKLLHTKEVEDIDTEELMGKQVMVTVRSVKSKRDGKYYLNIVKYAAVKEPKNKPLKASDKRSGGINQIGDILKGM